MKLSDYLKTVEAGSEITVWDNTYDIEVYFYTFAKYHRKDLFYACDTDSIMDDMENILAGCVQESWMSKFVDALEA